MHDSYFESYADPGVHRLMISDDARTDALRRAIEAVVKPGNVVLDLGTGTGILSLFAARAGAGRVYAVDDSSILMLAKQLAKANGLEQRIEFIRGRSERVKLEERVDVIVSEWMGYFALAECMFKSVIEARDRWLAPGGRMIPAVLRLFVAPVDDAELHVAHGSGLWEQPLYGLDFTPMVEHEFGHLIASSCSISQAALLGPGVEVARVDCAKDPVDAFFFAADVELGVERDGTLHGFCGWFEVDLAPQVTLATGPDAPETHWRQTYFPIRPFALREGDRIRLALRAREAESGDRRLPMYFMDAETFRDGELVKKFFYCHHASFE